MTPKQVQKINLSVVHALLLHELLESKEMKTSKWFSKRFAKKTMLKKYELKQILETVTGTQSPDYLSDIDNLKNLVSSFTDLLFQTAHSGKQQQFLEIIMREGMKLAGTHDDSLPAEAKATTKSRRGLRDRLKGVGISI